ncbi:MAG: ABC transporter ATP-binding protein [Candidatus Omnitrophica bacterium]|nr:ABC transporter ATP-binding protein [Candidatus Omnitrophota bacterium]
MAVKDNINVFADKVNKYYYLLDKSSDIFRVFIDKNSLPTFHALSDICFSLKKGDKLGIIGLNGSGKTTLLRVLSGILEHTGKVVVDGSKFSVLGAEFPLKNLFLTGEETARRFLAIYGVSEDDALRVMDDIFEFSELEDWRHRHINSYSSGMLMRLLFSVITSVPADVYLIDEFIYVGDEYFIGKCYRRFLKLAEKGGTFIFVSHNWAFLKKLCNKLLWLKDGRVVNFGDSEKVLDDYIQQTIGKLYSNSNSEEDLLNLYSFDPAIYKKFIEIIECNCKYEENSLTVDVDLKLFSPVRDYRVYFNVLRTGSKEWCFASKSEAVFPPGEKLYQPKKIRLRFSPLYLYPGDYKFALYITPLKTDGIRLIYDTKTYLDDSNARFRVEDKRERDEGTTNTKYPILRKDLVWKRLIQ